jgi:hypothetical protein
MRLKEGGRVPRIEVEDTGTFDVEEGERLVLTIEDDAGVDILHDVGPEPQKRQQVSLQGRDHPGWLSAVILGTLKTLPLHQRTFRL